MIWTLIPNHDKRNNALLLEAAKGDIEIVKNLIENVIDKNYWNKTSELNVIIASE